MTDVLDYSDTYMRNVHNPDSLLEQAIHVLEEVEFDTFVGIGLSGTIAAVELARKMGKEYFIIRKPTDGSHSSKPAEGRLGKRWVFVDDLVSSGRTFSRVWDVIEGIRTSKGFGTEYVGAFLYNDGSYEEFVPAMSSHTHGWLYFSERYDGRYGPNPPKREPESEKPRASATDPLRGLGEALSLNGCPCSSCRRTTDLTRRRNRDKAQQFSLAYGGDRANYLTPYEPIVAGPVYPETSYPARPLIFS